MSESKHISAVDHFAHYSVSFNDFSILDQEIMTQVFVRIKVKSIDKVR